VGTCGSKLNSKEGEIHMATVSWHRTGAKERSGLAHAIIDNIQV
jgi:hypothetical protein